MPRGAAATHPQRPRRIVSGGQTGVDRAALDAALRSGIPCGGWCPAHRLAEDGPIDDRYPLSETDPPGPGETDPYVLRTRLNVRDSDATLVLIPRRPPTGGTALTVAIAQEMARPLLIVEPGAVAAAGAWISAAKIRTLNIAGPRESTAPGIYDEALAFLLDLFAISR